MAYSTLILTISILISVSVQQTPISVTRQCKDAEFPSLVSVQYFNISKYIHVCSGAIIHISYVLTTVGCIARIYSLYGRDKSHKPKLEDNVMITAGDLRNYKHPPSESQQSLMAKRFQIHDDFAWDHLQLFQYDIALIKVFGEFDVTHHVKIGIIGLSSMKPGRMVVAAGWAKLDNGNRSQFCLAMEATVLDKDKCYYPGEEARSKRVPVELDETRFCAGDIDGINDPCRIDAGTPLYRNRDGVIQVVGLFSYRAENCTIGYGGVYTDIKNFKEWILEGVRWVPQSENRYDDEEYVIRQY